MMFGSLIPLALVALGVYFLLRVFKKEGNPFLDDGNADPLKILKVRYAKGEITREEFERMKADMSDSLARRPRP